MDSAATTRAAVAGIAMAFMSLVLVFLGKDLFGWPGFVLAVLVVLLVLRSLNPVIIRWIRGREP